MSVATSTTPVPGLERTCGAFSHCGLCLFQRLINFREATGGLPGDRENRALSPNTTLLRRRKIHARCTSFPGAPAPLPSVRRSSSQFRRTPTSLPTRTPSPSIRAGFPRRKPGMTCCSSPTAATTPTPISSRARTARLPRARGRAAHGVRGQRSPTTSASRITGSSTSRRSRCAGSAFPGATTCTRRGVRPRTLVCLRFPRSRKRARKRYAAAPVVLAARAHRGSA